jgi:addiction module RelB/DinJ family antitoxin
MAKTNNLHIRIDPTIQGKAETVLKGLGMSISDAVTIFLNQVGLERRIPFQVELPEIQPSYCYGVYFGETPHNVYEWFEKIRQRLNPDFRSKVDRWLELAKDSSKKKMKGKWDKEDFWQFVFQDDESYGAFDSFEKLFKEAGLHLIYCYSDEPVAGPVPPFVAGFYLKKFDEDLALNRRKPRMYQALYKKLLTVFSSVEEKDLDYWGIYQEEEDVETKIYNSDALLFATSEDYQGNT